jgi:preprotein translocase subunit YajC
LNQDWLILMASGGQQGQSGGIFMLVWMALIFVVMYLLLIRPQRKKQKEHEKLLKELKKGDRVVTSGGMFGTIFAIDDERNIVVLKIGEDVKLEFLRSSIAAKVDK